MSEQIKTLKSSDFTEEQYWSFECPYCAEIGEIHEDPCTPLISVICDNCENSIKVQKNDD